MTEELKKMFPYQIALEDYKVEAADDSDPENTITHYFWDVVAMFSDKRDADKCFKVVDATHPGFNCMMFDYTQLDQLPDNVNPAN